VTIALWMILAAVLLPVLTTGLAKWGAPGMDNHQPRVWQETLTGWRRRAEWAHRNHFEALPGFAAAVLVAHVAHAPQVQVNVLAVLWVVFRVAYTACYVTDRASSRSLMWAGAFVCVIGLFVASA
jgi:uncharacterized MAPEG superfamily protein